MHRERTWKLVACGAAIAFLALTLGPLPATALRDVTRAIDDTLAMLPFVSRNALGRQDVEKVSNVVAFVAIGGVAVAWSAGQLRPFHIVGVCAAVSCAIEGYQAVLGDGRHASILDVALNTLGAAIGAAMVTRLWRRRSQFDRGPTH